MPPTECIFCKIIAGTLPCYKVFEDQHSIAFLTISPVSEGHTLVIPKHHYENIFDIESAHLQQLILSVQTTAKLLKKKLELTGLNIGINNGKPGQEVMHLHFHLMPRKKDDKLIPWPGTSATEKDLQQTMRKILF